MYLGKCVAIVMHFLNKDQRIEEETKNSMNTWANTHTHTQTHTHTHTYKAVLGFDVFLALASISFVTSL